MKIQCADGTNCLNPEKMKQWNEALRKSDGSYPDPIDNSPCDHSSKSK